MQSVFYAIFDSLWSKFQHEVQFSPRFLRLLLLGRHCSAGNVNGTGSSFSGDWQVGSGSDMSTANQVPSDREIVSAKRTGRTENWGNNCQ